MLSVLVRGIDESQVKNIYPYEIINIEHICEYEIEEPAEPENDSIY